MAVYQDTGNAHATWHFTDHAERGSLMRALRLVAFAPLSMELESVDLPDTPPPGMLLVEAHTTAVSAGTEIANLLALDLIADGSLQIEPLISHRLTGDEGASLFERLAASREELFGVLLQWRAD